MQSPTSRFSYLPTRHSLPATPPPKGFTLIELLIVIAIVAILATVVVLVLNPAQQLKQSRDSQRLSELATLTKALSIFQADQSGASFGSASTTYVSVPDSDSGCANLSLPPQPPGWTYRCATSANYRKIDGTGWIPLDLTQVTFKQPLGTLPIDPLNATSTKNYYTYTTSGTKYKLSAVLESSKFMDEEAADGGQDPAAYEMGSDTSLSPFDHGLMGYWNFEEGSGTSVLDLSGQANTGTWNGTGSHYTAGKVGAYAGLFSSSTSDFVSVPDSTSTKLASGGGTILAWVNPTSLTSSCSSAGAPIANSVAVKGSSGLGTSYGMTMGSVLYCAWYNNTTVQFTGPGFSNNIWQFLAVTQTTSQTQFFINGNLVGTTNSTYVMNGSTQPLRIGANASTGVADRFFSGTIDEVRLYNRVLSAAEILALYNATK